MEQVSVDKLNTGDFLAKNVTNDKGGILFYQGTKLTADNIKELKRNQIHQVYIFNEVSQAVTEEKEIIKEEIRSDCRESMRKVVSKYVCSTDSNLKDITETSDEIIDEIYTNEYVAYKVYEIKKRTPDVYDHCVSVCAMSIITAIRLNLSRDVVSEIGIGSLLHDLGLKYLTINYNKSTTELTYEDLFEYKKHTLYGFSSVENERWMSTISKRIILQHHENVDGTGYPFRQRSMPLPVKIVAVCDALDDMICGIGYNAMRVDEAIDNLGAKKDTYFDGRVVDTLLSFIVAYPVGTCLLLNTGEEAVVTGQNEYYTRRPTVKITKDSDGEPLQTEKIINLSENRSYEIERVL